MSGPLLLADGLDPTNEQARQWVRDELSDARYQPVPPQQPPQPADPSWLNRLGDWIGERIVDVLFPPAGGVSFEGILAIIVGTLLAVTIGVYLFRLLRRVGPRTPEDRDAVPDTVLPTDPPSADAYRRRAVDARNTADFDVCVTEAMRAIARRADERALITSAQTYTACEISTRLAIPFPEFADELDWAATLFDAVVYGGRTADADGADRILGLAAALTKAAPARVADDEETDDDSGAIAPTVVSG